MNFLTLWKRLVRFFLNLFSCHIPRPRPKISLLIPFSSRNRVRRRTLNWLLEYWEHELPEAEIIVRSSRGRVFCKGEALNRAMKKARGKIIVIIDSDAYISGDVLSLCADRMLEELENHLWYVPYRHLYRLTKEASEFILDSHPACPIRLSSPPPPEFIEKGGDKSKYGHRYGAMCMMFPKEAYDILGCFDERFKGWGGEDIALLRALDTLYGKHKTTENDILHLWHPFLGENYTTRKWEGQASGGVNNELANKYNKATGKPSKMRKLVDKGCKKKNCK